MTEDTQCPDFRTTALALPKKATEIIITDQESYDYATNTLKDIASLRKSIEAHYAPLKKAAHDAHKTIVAAEKKYLGPLNTADKTIRKTVADWTAEQERIQQEKIRKQEEERMAREAEERRVAEEKRLKEAEEAEELGKSQAEVEAILDKPIEKPAYVPPPIAEPSYIPSSGVTSTKTYKAEVYDIKVLCAAVAEGKAPVETVLPNMSLLNQMARKSKADLSIPGVNAVEESNVRIR